MAAATLSMQVGATISMDKAAQWDRYSATLPLSRRQVIGEKYALAYLLSWRICPGRIARRDL